MKTSAKAAKAKKKATAAKKAKAVKRPAKKAAKKPTKKVVKTPAKKRGVKAKPRKASTKAVAVKRVKAAVKVPPKKAARKPAPAKLAPRSATPAPEPNHPPLVKAVLAQLDDSKAEQIVTIDLTNRSTMADTMIVASGRSNRHVSAISDQVVEMLEKSGKKNLRVEGKPQCDWVLVDSGDVIIHIFRPEVRSFYNLEKLWSAHAPVDPSSR